MTHQRQIFQFVKFVWKRLSGIKSRPRARATAALIFTIIFLPPTAIAQTEKTKAIEKFKDWTLFSHASSDVRVCFLGSLPQEAKPVGYTRKRSIFYISAWPKSGVKAEISTRFGKPLGNGSEVKVRIGSARYTLFTKGNQAFAEDPRQELNLINSMKRGREMVVSGVAADGTNIEDIYSLSGVTAGVNSLRATCN